MLCDILIQINVLQLTVDVKQKVRKVTLQSACGVKTFIIALVNNILLKAVCLTQDKLGNTVKKLINLLNHISRGVAT